MRDEQTEGRMEKVEALKTQGISAYPDRFSVNYELFEASQLEDGTSGVRVAGRIMSIRNFKNLIFITISNIQGSLQLLLKRDEIGEIPFKQFNALVDIGDFIGVEGKMYLTNTKEKTLRIESYVLLGKTLRSLPEKWHGLSNIELR